MPADANTLSAASGAYIVEYHLAEGKRIKVGKRGDRLFPAGAYLYPGSAYGPGGLRARLKRHLSLTIERPHWHIDYLHLAARPSAVCYLPYSGRARTSPPLECRWSQALDGLADVAQPAPAFGAGDCRSGCRAHLVLFTGLQLETPILFSKHIQDIICTTAGLGSVGAGHVENIRFLTV